MASSQALGGRDRKCSEAEGGKAQGKERQVDRHGSLRDQGLPKASQRGP